MSQEIFGNWLDFTKMALLVIWVNVWCIVWPKLPDVYTDTLLPCHIFLLVLFLYIDTTYD